MRFAVPAVLLLLLAQVSGPTLGQSATRPIVSTITFPSGSMLTTVNGQLALGSSDLYYVPARAGQTLLVSVDSADGDISFQVYAPDASVAKTADGKTTVRGRTLPDAGAHDNARAWVGAISRSGNYLIAVSMGETGAVLGDYSLTVSLQ